MAHYYESPQPDQFPKWIRDASASGAFEKPSARFPLMTFATEVLRMNPTKGEEWCKALASLPPAHKAFVGWSFINSRIPGAEQCVRTQLGLSVGDVQKVLGANRHDPLSREPSTPGDLDLLWAVFCATGSEVAVNKIIDVLARPSPERGTPGSIEMLLIKSTARWSLSSNVQQHKRVAEIVRNRRVLESGTLHKELDEVIANASR